MKRLIFSAAILLAVLILSASSLIALDHTEKEIAAIAADIRLAADRGDSARAEAAKLLECWEKNYKLLSCIENANTLNTAAISIYRVQYLSKEGSEELYAELDSICGQLAILRETRFPNLHAVL